MVGSRFVHIVEAGGAVKVLPNCRQQVVPVDVAIDENLGVGENAIRPALGSGRNGWVIKLRQAESTIV